MDGHQHMSTTTIAELDLSTCYPYTIVDRINAVPGLKTSTAFFTFLRANLVLPPSSNVSTPYLEPMASHTLAPPSPSPLATGVMNPGANPSTPASSVRGAALDDADIPPLSLDILTDKEDKVAALKLVADSIAQQRQQASTHLIYHPICLAGLATALAVAYQVPRQKDLGTLTTLGCGIIMAYLLATRYLTAPYIRIAEEINWSFLLPSSDSSSGSAEEEDIILATKFGGEIVGALVLRLEGGAGGGSGSSSLSSSSGHSSPRKRGGGRGAPRKGGKGVIRAWTTKMRYRGKGVGGDLLREAVRVTRERCGRDAEVGFAREHANSRMVLPETFNGGFRKREMRAARALDAVLGEYEGRKRR